DQIVPILRFHIRTYHMARIDAFNTQCHDLFFQLHFGAVEWLRFRVRFFVDRAR
ncbi:hypothetical protein D046_3942, partial [Vibrio parahaemolyticus V-223/04]